MDLSRSVTPITTNETCDGMFGFLVMGCSFARMPKHSVSALQCKERQRAVHIFNKSTDRSRAEHSRFACFRRSGGGCSGRCLADWFRAPQPVRLKESHMRSIALCLLHR